MINTLDKLCNPVVKLLDSIGQPVILLITRLWMAKVFFAAGLTKIQSWDTTLLLFEYEYAVPVLPPVLAAYSGTFVELVFPILLAIGLCGRASAIILFIFNLIAVIAYTEGLNEATLNIHLLWGALFAVIAAFGPGKLSLDHLLRKKFC